MYVLPLFGDSIFHAAYHYFICRLRVHIQLQLGFAVSYAFLADHYLLLPGTNRQSSLMDTYVVNHAGSARTEDKVLRKKKSRHIYCHANTIGQVQLTYVGLLKQWLQGGSMLCHIRPMQGLIMTLYRTTFTKLNSANNYLSSLDREIFGPPIFPAIQYIALKKVI